VQRNAKINIGIIHTVLIIFSVLMVTPFIWMVLTSIKSFGEATVIPPIIFPKVPVWQNYSKAVAILPFAAFYYNTIVMIGVRVLGVSLFSTMAAYAFARIRFPGKNLLFILVLMQLMVPGQIFIVPQYMLMAKLGWLNTVKALIAPGIVSAFGTFLLRQFFMGIPNDLEEAAVIDGCNHWRIYWNVMLPLAKSGLVALGIFTALFAWKDLMWPLIVNISMQKMTLASGLASLVGQYSTDYPVLMAGSVIAIWPMILVFVIFQKQFVQGIALTGTKA
jgi:multiple sugar transport system permease protein